MPSYNRIQMALKSLGLDGQYLSKFIENKIDDDLLHDCLQDSQQLFNFNEIIPVVGDRIRFFKAYNSMCDGSPVEALPAKPSPDSIDLNNLTPRPIQIMDFEEPINDSEPSEVIFHQHIFKQILMKTKTDKVALISIAGPSRKGKSFFLNFILRYLQERKNSNINTNWMQSINTDELLNGFEWKTTTDRVTKGIWLWSEPFPMKSANGDDFDLLIMDTQGVFDKHTTMREWLILVGLALLASSCLIFNVVGDIQEDALRIFDKFLDFGLMALDENDNAFPFQNLLFLVRDWNVPVEFPYGFTGGRKYLRSKLNAETSHRESRNKIRQQLKDCFEDISCCLLPHPGEQFLQQNFNGFIIQKDDPFAAEIGKCMPEIMDPANIPMKKINGNPALKADILQAFSNYCNFFNTKDALSPDSIFQIMSKQSNELVVRNCVEQFKNELNMQLGRRPFFLRNDLTDIKETAMQRCLDIFDESRIMGDRSLFKLELLRQLQESFQVIKDGNYENLKIVTSEAFDKASIEFIGIVSNVMKDSTISSNALDALLLESERKACATFSSHCGVKNIEMIPEEAVKFHDFVRLKSKDFRNDNALKKDTAERTLNNVIQKLVDAYVKNMQERSHGRVVSEKQIADLHDVYRKQSIDEFNALHVNEDFIREAEGNLHEKIAAIYERIHKDILSSNEKINSQGSGSVLRAASDYLNSAMENITANKADWDQIQKKFFRRAQKRVIDGCQIDDAHFLENILAQLSSECAKHNLALNDSYKRIRSDIETKLSDGRDEAIDRYKFALAEMLPQNDPVDFETLDDTHDEAMQKSTEFFEDVFRQICETYKGVDENLFTSYKVDVEVRIQLEFDSAKQLNTLKRSNAEAKAVELFANAKESYGSRMKEVQDMLTDEEELMFNHSGIKKDLSENLRQQLRVLCLSDDQQENFVKDFDSHIENEFEVTLEICRMRVMEDAALYERMHKDILSSNEKINSQGSASVIRAASDYYNSAMENITANKAVLEQLQQNLFRTAQRTVIDGCPIGDAQFLEKLLAELSSECAKHNVALNNSYKRIRSDIETKLSDGRDEAIDRYKFALAEILSQNDPVDFETLDDTHVEAMQKSTEFFEDVFRQICETYKGVDENLFTSYKVDVEVRIQLEFDSAKQLNTLKWSNPEAKAVKLFANAKESYGSRMREVQDMLTDEEELMFNNSGIKKDLSENLLQQLKVLCLSDDQQENFVRDFHSHVESEFEVTLEICRMRMAEDELIVRTAFLDAREFYKDEIEKHLQSKDWFEVSELDELHEVITEAAIEKSSAEVDITEIQELQLKELFDNLFKKYRDRNLLRMPIDDYAIGIDLGTTYSCVAVCIQGKVTVIAENEKTTIPSYIAFRENLSVDVGEAAKEQSFRRPDCTIFDAKRLIGRKFSDKIVQDDMKLWPFEVVDSSDQPKIKIPGHGETYYPELISARVLAHLKKMAEDFLNKKVKNAVVTVPAYFSESQRHATKDAARIAGLNAKILNEPTAAAISYELHRTDDFTRNVLIFDLGGGTFDVAVLKMHGGEVIVKAINGDTHLGGEDFDNEMVKHIIKVVKEGHNIDLGRDVDSNDRALRHDASVRLRRIRSACEKQKRLLSMSDSVKITIEKIDGNFDLDETFTRAQFGALNMTKFKDCIDITAAVISDAKMVKSDIDDIVLIGGSTRIPKVRELLIQFFDGKALNKQINADEAVAYGAAIQAALMFGKSHEVRKNVHLKDVTPMSLDVRVVDGSVNRIKENKKGVSCNVM